MHETCTLSRAKQITSPGWMCETSAWGWCTGKTQRNQVEREVGGGIGMGIHVNPWLIHVNVWQKSLQYCKVISLIIIIIIIIIISLTNKWKNNVCKMQSVLWWACTPRRLAYFWKLQAMGNGAEHGKILECSCVLSREGTFHFRWWGTANSF